MVRKQAGFMIYAALAAGIALLGMGVALKVQSSRLDACKQEFAGFKAQVQALGEAAEAKAKAQEASDKAKKAKYDKEIIKLRAANAAANSKLLDNAGRGSLSATRSLTGKPDGTACYNAGILDSAIRAFTSGTAGIATEGQSAVDELENARQWAADRAK